LCDFIFITYRTDGGVITYSLTYIVHTLSSLSVKKKKSKSDIIYFIYQSIRRYGRNKSEITLLVDTSTFILPFEFSWFREDLNNNSPLQSLVNCALLIPGVYEMNNFGDACISV
jgi:hypothetical protein